MSDLVGIVLGIILLAVVILTMWFKCDDQDWPIG